ncbi:MAG: nucleoside-diphosphate kinase [candidate division WOR-3 bacterium]
MDRIFVMIKPDAVAKGVIGQIITRFESMGFAILRMEMKRLSQGEAERFYEPHRGKEFYGKLVDFITSGPVVGILLGGPDAVFRVREAMGTTDPAGAKPGTLRRLFGTDITHNAIHGSDSPENVAREAGIFFGINLD